jgi:hypothetical protein
MNHYELKQEARRDRLEAAADRAEAKSVALYVRSDMSEAATGIPFGQPILVGHHSEGRHRAAIKRAENAIRSSIKAGKYAKEMRGKAEGVGSGGISSDDPAAVQKLQAQINAATHQQNTMREANKVIRRAVKAGVKNSESAGYQKFKDEIGKVYEQAMRDDTCNALIQPDFCGRIGFPSYRLTNNGANIKRMQGRVDQLRIQNAQAEAAGGEDKRTVYEGVCDLVENFEENRIQIVFDGKPSAEVRAELKGNGFRWAPSQSAWQRQLNNAGRYAAKCFLKSQNVEA